MYQVRTKAQVYIQTYSLCMRTVTYLCMYNCIHVLYMYQWRSIRFKSTCAWPGTWNNAMQWKEDFRKCIFQFLSWIPHKSLGHLTCAEESPGMKMVLWFSSFVLILICTNLFRITRICLDLQEFDYICKNLLRFAGICLDLQWFLWFVILCLDLQEFVWICKKAVA